MTAIYRLIPVARVAFCLALVLVVLNAVMRATDAAFPNWLPRELQGTGFTVDIAQRVSTAEKIYPPDARQGKYLCALLGLSGIREGIDMKLLNREVGDKVRILGLGGAGPSFQDVSDQSASLLASKLSPDLVVIGINEFHQARPTIEIVVAAQNEQLTLSQAIARGDIRHVIKWFVDRTWFVTRRQDVSLAAETSLLSVRDRIVHAFGATIQNPMTDPWRDMMHLEAPHRATEATFHEMMHAFEGRGLFEDSTYRLPMATKQLQYLEHIVSGMQARGARVVLVLMPEYSTLYASIPPFALEHMRRQLAADMGASCPPIVDDRIALPDSDFADIAHANTDGRIAYTRKLAATILKQLPTDRPPLTK